MSRPDAHRTIGFALCSLCVRRLLLRRTLAFTQRDATPARCTLSFRSFAICTFTYIVNLSARHNVIMPHHVRRHIMVLCRGTPRRAAGYKHAMWPLSNIGRLSAYGGLHEQRQAVDDYAQAVGVHCKLLGSDIEGSRPTYRNNFRSE